ncbi:MAG: beta-carotene 15,15'-dioxygenase, Brp/Blh family [Flavobacteriales bacterium]
MSHPTHFDFLFLGMGCGNSLMLLELNEQGMLSGKRILVVEPESLVRNDRTFCFWMEPERVNEGFLASLIENQWSTVHVGETTQSLDPCCYYRISGKLLSERVQTLLDIEQVQTIRALYDGIQTVEGEQAILKISGETFTADFVFDNRPPRYDVPCKSETRLFQSFYGWEVKTELPAFESDCFTMMDFKVKQEGATQFMYVLPMDAHRALVEITRFGEAIISPSSAEQSLNAYLSERSIDFTIEDKEQGVIPMFSQTNAATESTSCWINTGERAGMLKPSTGYSFERSLRYATGVVQGIKSKQLIVQPKQTRFAYYDRLLLQLLRDRPEKGAKIFTQLFQKNSVLKVFKFLDERSALSEDLSILGSLPIGLFVRAAIKDFIWRSARYFQDLSPMLLISGLAVVLQAFGQISTVYGILGVGMVALGVPHGALDHLHALKKPWGWNMLGYVLTYLGLGALILVLFWLSPWVGLLCFMAYSMWHFGEADMAHWHLGRTLMAMLWGGYFLLGLLVSHLEETVYVLRDMNVLLPDVLPLNKAFGLGWILLGGACFMGWTRNRYVIVSVLSLLVLSTLPLMPAFGIFFIFQHSFHGWKKLKELTTDSELKRWIKALPFTVGAFLLFGLNAYFESFSWGQFFIFLAALSFPHVVLMSIFYRKSKAL